MIPVKNYIKGEWAASSSGKSIASIDPANQEVVAEGPYSSIEDAEAAIAAARELFDHSGWPFTEGQQRATILLELARKLRASADELALLITRENGRPIHSTRGEVLRSAEIAEYYAAQARTLQGRSNLTVSNALSLVSYEPVGVCGLIVPWNFPIDLAVRKIAPALAAGCTIVLKPSLLVPATSAALMRLFDEIDALPKGVVNMVIGDGPDVGDAIVRSPQVDKISFTGATTTGKAVLRAAADTMKRVSLECGGKSPNIIFDDAPLEQAIHSALWGTFHNSGQSCSAKSRVIVHESLHDTLITELQKRVSQIRVGWGTKADTEVGPLVSQAQLDTVLSYIEIGLDEGAKRVTGGARMTGAEFERGFFIEPAVFDDVQPSMQLAQHEIFGPVLAVMSFEDEEDAIALANATSFGLSAAIWTRDISRAMRVARRVRSGEVMVNTSGMRLAEGPFGGYGQSGIGRELGDDVLLEYQ